ncbi:hypothetical protein Agabi119p4_11590 [Agaricus bisporus var. burnettii]|uniref:Uncharacterized protein n=1 Tax=Agaricus bisporus var. burnettii TaxID=192524 RepID=A0A8H7EVV0_AGABI|nr:hypothetical protein Agabi119p4_11590 [Agaricus bisporus var. burnettii]
MKLLDTIAWLLTTGLPGDYYAVAFDKRKGVEVILAKNGTPTSGDLAFSLFSAPVQKLLSFILESGFYDDFYSKLDQRPSVHNTILPNNIKWEFFRDASSILKGFEGQPLSVVMRILFDAAVVIATRVVSSQGLDVEDFLTRCGGFSVSKLPCLNDCTFLLFGTMGKVGFGRYRVFAGTQISAMCRKLCRYVDGVESLVRYAKRLGGPVPYRWVTDELLGVQKGEENVRIDSETPLEAVRRASFWSLQQLAGWKARKPSIVEPWQRTTWQIIIDLLGSVKQVVCVVHYGWRYTIDITTYGGRQDLITDRTRLGLSRLLHARMCDILTCGNLMRWWYLKYSNGRGISFGLEQYV